MEVVSPHRSRGAAATAAPLDATFSEPIERLRVLLAEDPHDVETLGRLGDAQLADHDPDGALVTATRAIELAPERAQPHRQASIACSRRGRHREALAYAEEATRLAPDDHRGFVVLARALLRAKCDLERARHAAVRAIVTAPEAAEAHLVFGMVSAAEGEHAAAEAAFRRALQLDPETMTARNELARLELRRAVEAGAGKPADGSAVIVGTVNNAPRAGAARRNLDDVRRTLQACLRSLRATA
jgi:tetratricopeptide (TPR) repeat protein